MFSDVPNLAYAMGYTNASWTLKCELTSRYVCRLLNRMEARGDDWCVPRGTEGLTVDPAWGLTSGYAMRAADILHKQADRKPRKLHQNYARDLAALKFVAVSDRVMQFGRAARAATRHVPMMRRRRASFPPTARQRAGIGSMLPALSTRW